MDGEEIDNHSNNKRGVVSHIVKSNVDILREMRKGSNICIFELSPC